MANARAGPRTSTLPPSVKLSEGHGDEPRYLPCAQPQNGHLGPGVQLHIRRHSPTRTQKHHHSSCRRSAFNSGQARPSPARRGKEMAGRCRCCIPPHSCAALALTLCSPRRGLGLEEAASASPGAVMSIMQPPGLCQCLN